MRKLAALTAVATAAAGTSIAAAPAAAQDRPVTLFNSNAQIFPKKAGTKRNPRGIRIAGNFRFLTTTAGVEPPIVTGGTLFLTKHGRYRGGAYAKCSRRVLSRPRGPRGCPRRSIMGQGKGVAFADNVDARPEVVLVNGGKNLLWAYTTLYNPALVQEPIAVRIRRVRHRTWGYRVSFNVPEVLQVVAGVPITLRSFNYTVGGRRYARNFIVTTGCPRNGRYPYRAIARFLYNDNTRASAQTRGTVRCRR